MGISYIDAHFHCKENISLILQTQSQNHHIDRTLARVVTVLMKQLDNDP